jgi:hypothetical protein
MEVVEIVLEHSEYKPLGQTPEYKRRGNLQSITCMIYTSESVQHDVGIMLDLVSQNTGMHGFQDLHSNASS